MFWDATPQQHHVSVDSYWQMLQDRGCFVKLGAVDCCYREIPFTTPLSDGRKSEEAMVPHSNQLREVR